METPASVPFPSTEESAWRARAVRLMSLTVLVATIPALIHNWVMGVHPAVYVLALEQVMVLAVLWLLWRGRLDWAINLFCLSCLGCLTLLITLNGEGFHDIAMLGMPGLVVVSALLLNRHFFVALTALAITIVGAVGWGERHGLIGSTIRGHTTYGTISDALLILVVTAVAVGLLAGGLRDSLARIRESVAALTKSEDRFRRMIELAVDAIILLDPDLTISDVNQNTCEITGYAKEELLGKPLSFLFSAEELERTPFSFDRLRQGMAITNTRSVRRKDGTAVPVEMKSGMMSDGRFQTIMRDVSERIRLTEQLQQSQKLESIGRLAGGVAHDFNNLLTIINGYCEMMLRTAEETSPDRSRLLQIAKAGARAADLTHQLLVFSRKQVIQPRPLNLNSEIADSEKMLGRLLGEDIELMTVLDPALGNVMADPGQMQQVLLNLAANARDAMPKGGKLLIETRTAEIETLRELPENLSPGRYIQLAVSDTGLGMDEPTRAQVFEPFFTTKPQGQGTGLGLSMVYGIVRQSKGRIRVYSEPGQGTTFEISLPQTDEPPHTQPAVPPPGVELHGSETILVVEDQVEVRRFACNVLRTFGYRVLDAADGPEAIRVVHTVGEPIHLLLSDVVMPGMGGRELAVQLRALDPKLRVLFMSGYADDGMQRGALEPGIAYVSKPFLPNDLATKVRQVLEAS